MRKRQAVALVKKYRVIIPQNVQPVPERFEVSAASLLLEFFKADIQFLPVMSMRTPDIEVAGEKWEIKSPIGGGKYTIQRQFQRAAKQSKNIVIDARRIKIHIARVRREVAYQAGLAKSIAQVLLIEKTGKVVRIK